MKPYNSEVQQTGEKSSVVSHIDHEPQSIITEKEQEVQISQVTEVEPERMPKTEKLQIEKLQDEIKLISHAKLESSRAIFKFSSHSPVSPLFQRFQRELAVRSLRGKRSDTNERSTAVEKLIASHEQKLIKI